jgi:transglutaminase-like putative cysteine protease
MENKPKRYWDLLSIFFLGIALWDVVQRLTATKWTQYLDLTELFLLVGFGLGILLGKSRFSGRTAAWFGFVYTIGIVPYQIAGTMGSDLPWLERYIETGQRLNVIFYWLFHNQAVQDNLLFLCLMALLIWLLAITAGYRLVRYGRPWVPLAILALVLLIVDQYSTYIQYRNRYLVVFLLCALFLIGRLYYLHSRDSWIEKGYTVDSEIGFSLARIMVIGGLVIILLSWNLPVLANTGANQVMRNRVSGAFSDLRSRFSNALAGLRNPIVYVNDSYGGKLGLGTSAVQGDSIVFRVSVASIGQENLRFYWRGNSWDYYNGREWSSSINQQDKAISSDWPLDSQIAYGRTSVNLTFEIVGGVMQKVYVPNQPEFVSRAVNVVANSTKNHPDMPLDIVSLLASPVLRPGDKVSAEAAVSVPTIAQLRKTSTDYPEWVKTYYLQLPSHFSTAVKDKAKELTADQTTTYDKVEAVTEYLRNTITYERTIENPPANQDPIEWFLFDYKKGFCNYYATTEVLMLRSVGIPARLVTGYAQGELNPETHLYEVRTRDAHAWPEVYFPGYGWVEFEPTAGQPARILAAGTDSSVNADASNNNAIDNIDRNHQFTNDRNLLEEADIAERPARSVAQTTLPYTIAVSIGVLFFAVVGYIAWKRPFSKFKPLPVWLEERYQKSGVDTPRLILRWAVFARLTPIERLYLGLSILLWVRRMPISGGETPAERLTRVTVDIPEAFEPGQAFLEEYQRALFSRHPYDLKRARKMYAQIWFTVLVASIRKLFNSPNENYNDYNAGTRRNGS